MSYLTIGILYFIACLLTTLVIGTLVMELKAKKSRFILFLTAHFTVELMLFSVIAIDLVARHYGIPKTPFIGIEVRAILTVTVLAALLYDMWEHYFKNKIKR